MPAEPVFPTADADPALWNSISELCAMIRRGELVTFPTDTVVALATSHTNPDALDRIYAVKRREPVKPIPLLVSHAAQLAHLTANVPTAARILAAAFWPGGLTIILPASPGLPAAVAPIGPDGRASIAVRMPAHPLALAIIANAGGALAATSANISGEPPAPTAAAAKEWLGPLVHAALDWPFPTSNAASTIVDLSGNRPVVVRDGAISAGMIAATLAAYNDFSAEADRLW